MVLLRLFDIWRWGWDFGRSNGYTVPSPRLISRRTSTAKWPRSDLQRLKQTLIKLYAHGGKKRPRFSLDIRHRVEVQRKRRLQRRQTNCFTYHTAKTAFRSHSLHHWSEEVPDDTVAHKREMVVVLFLPSLRSPEQLRATSWNRLKIQYFDCTACKPVTACSFSAKIYSHLTHFTKLTLKCRSLNPGCHKSNFSKLQ